MKVEVILIVILIIAKVILYYPESARPADEGRTAAQHARHASAPGRAYLMICYLRKYLRLLDYIMLS